MMSEDNNSNPEIGMNEDNIDSIQDSNKGSDDFFNSLEDEVNGMVQDDTPEATHQNTSGTNEVTRDIMQGGSDDTGGWNSDGNPYKKRYSDSSREAVKMREQLNELEPFIPVLNAMKQDSGLVEHVRDYLTGGGTPAKSIQDKLELDDDFMFDSHEAVTDPDSDSAKLMNAHVNGIVNQRVSRLINQERESATKMQAQIQRKQEEESFKVKHNMDDETFSNFVERAKMHKMSLDDVNYILNKDQVGANIANSTKNDMLTQMKNVRNLPTSASGVNSQGGQSNPEHDVFDTILGDGADLDQLFG